MGTLIAFLFIVGIVIGVALIIATLTIKVVAEYERRRYFPFGPAEGR